MKLRFSVLALSVCILSAQTPNISGVWKANLEKSKFAGGRTPTEFVMIVEQNDSVIKGTEGVGTPRGPQRTSFTFNTARPNVNSVMGIPMRAKTSWDGNTLVVEEHAGGARPGDIHEKYTLSPDGNTLTVETAVSMNGHDSTQTVVFEKQPDSAGDALRKPEETAGAHFKNVTILKDLPASQLLEAMRYFTFSLGKDCEFCHAQGDFASDAKKTKATARMMLTMTHNINEANFKGNMEVRCFTCHQGHQEPLRMPE